MVHMNKAFTTISYCTAILISAVCLLFSPHDASAKQRIVIIPKIIGISYYDAVKKGIDEAARELPDIEVIWKGSTQDQVEKQIDIIEDIIPTRPDVIAVAANDPVRIVPVLKKAQSHGIHVMSWDGDTGFREFFVNLVDYNVFGSQLLEAMVEQVGPSADIGIITTTFTAPNQVRWIQAIKKHKHRKYKDINILDIRPARESTERAYRISRQFLADFPTLKGIIALGVPNVPGAVKAVVDSGKEGKIAIVGNATPNLTREYLKKGYMQKVHLWNAPDHGYLTVYCAYKLLSGGLQPGKKFNAGRLGELVPKKDALSMQVALPVVVFTRENIDQFRF